MLSSFVKPTNVVVIHQNRRMLSSFVKPPYVVVIHQTDECGRHASNRRMLSSCIKPTNVILIRQTDVCRRHSSSHTTHEQKKTLPSPAGSPLSHLFSRLLRVVHLLKFYIGNIFAFPSIVSSTFSTTCICSWISCIRSISLSSLIHVLASCLPCSI